ncbi:YgaP family membrane protein [Halorussus sp. AFM4]|uniref:YgaP family membrane protein n=1 Tax=Halorussus sp. AFM4 TaxID=3421651 RepID=UPI003EBB7A24
MQQNVGGLDEGIRITLGPLLLVLSIGSFRGALRLRRSVAVGALVVGAVLTATGLTQTCPANSAMGRDTYRDAGEGATGGLSEEARQVRDRALR